MLGSLEPIASDLAGASSTDQQLVIAVARDVVQDAIIAAGGPSAATSPPFALADHALLTGNPGRAASLSTALSPL